MKNKEKDKKSAQEDKSNESSDKLKETSDSRNTNIATQMNKMKTINLSLMMMSKKKIGKKIWTNCSTKTRDEDCMQRETGRKSPSHRLGRYWEKTGSVPGTGGKRRRQIGEERIKRGDENLRRKKGSNKEVVGVDCFVTCFNLLIFLFICFFIKKIS